MTLRACRATGASLAVALALCLAFARSATPARIDWPQEFWTDIAEDGSYRSAWSVELGGAPRNDFGCTVWPERGEAWLEPQRVLSLSEELQTWLDGYPPAYEPRVACYTVNQKIEFGGRYWTQWRLREVPNP